MNTTNEQAFEQRPRAVLLRWAGWFFITNAGLMAIMGLRYLIHYPFPDEFLGQLYTVVAYLGQFTLLGGAPLLLLAPLILLLPRPGLIRSVAIVLAALMLAVLLLDTLVFAQNRFHLNALTVAILGWKSWTFGVIYLLIFLTLEFFLARLLWRSQNASPPRRPRHGPLLASTLIGCLLLTQVLHIWADARYYVPITSFTPYLPLFTPMTAKSFLTRHGLMDVAAERNRAGFDHIGEQHSQRLDYPKQPLHCDAGNNPYNVLIILIDAMRGDSLQPELTPGIMDFAKHSTVFEQHYSGGNSSRIGTFSLFYGLPSSYWSDFHALQRPPVLIKQLQAQGYEFGIFTSKPLYRPTNMDRTVFAGIANLPDTPKEEHDYDKDRKITRRWLEWMAQRKSEQPFFGFLFYDSLNYQVYPPDYPRVRKVPEGASELEQKRANYLTSLHFQDSLVGQVLDDLEQRDLLDQTVVLISADHGQEFDDTGLGYVGYGSNFSKYQLHVPMIVHWPGREAARIERRTAHRDVPPTLLRRVLRCRNPADDYSTGNDLFEGEPWQWLVTGSYSDYAVVESDRVTVVKPGGYFEIRGHDYQLLKDARVNQDAINKALAAMKRYY